MEERLHKFVSVAEAKSFSKAARQLHISQPALSAAIQKLERELKTPLIVRGARTIALTPSGEVVLQAGKQQQAHLEHLRHRLREVATGKTMLRIGLIDSLAETLFLDQDELRALTEQCDVSLVIDSTRRLHELLEREQLDIAFAVQSETYPESVSVYENLGAETMVAVAATHFAHTVREQIATGTAVRLLSYNHGSQTDRIIHALFASEGIEPDIELHSTSPHLLLGLVIKGRGIAILPFTSVEPHLQSGSLESLTLGKTTLIPRPLVVLAGRGKIPHPALITLIDRASSTLHEVEARAKKRLRT